MKWLIVLWVLLLPASPALAQSPPQRVVVLGKSCNFPRIDFTTGSLGVASLTRSSSATYINNSGVLSTATTNTARFNYDTNYPGESAAPSLTGPFLLVEPSATNMLLQSNAFTTTWILFGGGSVSAAAFVSPDGTNDGWSSLNVGGGGGGILQGINPLSAVPYIYSAWMKILTGSGNGYIFQIGSSSTGGGLPLPITATLIRYSGSLTAGAGFNNTFIYSSGSSGTNGIYGAQIELPAASGYFATKPSSYIVTTTSQISRSADVVTFGQPAGCARSLYTFDDGTSQTVVQSAGIATVPTNLNRPNIKFIDGRP